jgi:putative redox protein
MQKVHLKWIDNLRFFVNDESGHSLVIDTKKEVGGTETGFQPIDLILVSLAGCMAFDMVSILKKMKSELKHFSVSVEGERATEHPKRYTKILIKFKTNDEIKEADLQKVFELSRDKYCSVFWTLQIPPEINFAFEKE